MGKDVDPIASDSDKERMADVLKPHLKGKVLFPDETTPKGKVVVITANGKTATKNGEAPQRKALLHQRMDRNPTVIRRRTN